MSTSNTKISTNNKASSETKDLSDSDLDQVSGGVGLLLPAVQAAPKSRDIIASESSDNTKIKKQP